jgi:hypothetical protein
MDLRWLAAPAALGILFVSVGCAHSLDETRPRRNTSSANSTAPGLEDVGSTTEPATETGSTDDADTTTTTSEDTGTSTTTSPTTLPTDDDAGRVVDSGVPTTLPTVDASADPCTTCVYGSCGAQLDACRLDSGCTAQMDCLSGCADDACASACATSYPSTLVAPLMTCISTNCTTACGGP